MHEIHRPGLVHLGGDCQRLRHFPNDALFRLDSKVQLQIAVDPVDPLVIPSEPLDVSQKKVAKSETPVLLVVGQTDQPVSNLGVLVRELRLIPIAVLADE